MEQKINIDRVQLALKLFHEGYNCSQSVACAWADHYGMDIETMARVAASFGAGIGRMRKTCGAACGMFILAGLEHGASDPHDQDKKSANYKIVQQLAAEFARRNGDLECGVMLKMAGLDPNTSSTAEKRTPEYYKKRPCPRIIEEAARIWQEHLEEQKSL